MAKVRIHFQDVGQDLLNVTIDIGPDKSSDMGEIVSVPASVSPEVAKIYFGKAVDLQENSPGQKFKYADPMRGFTVHEPGWKVSSLEWLEDQQQAEGGEK